MSEAQEGKQQSENVTGEANAGPPGSDAAAASEVAASSTAGGGSSAAPDSSTNQASEAGANSTAASTADTPSQAGGAESTAADSSAASTPTSPGVKSVTSSKSGGVSSSKSPSGTGAAAQPSTTRHPQRSRKVSSSGRPRGAKLGQLKLEEAKIGVIGAGKMADALVQGLIHYAKIHADRIHVASPSAKNLDTFKNYGCRVTKRNYDIFGRYDCDIIFLAFHGHVIKNCYKLGGARPHPLTTNYIPHQRHPIYILSMVSGVSLTQIKACLLNPESTNRYVLEIHRIMMNTAVGQGLGICAVDCEPDSRKLSAPLRQLLSSIAHLEHVPASQMDAACAIGGSGLAFSYYFINALADGAFKMGLSRKQAIRFASKTAQCAAQTMLESGKHPAELRDTVSAPSGAAIYGIHVLEKNDVASGVTAAVEAAHKRASELANEIKS